MAFNQPDILPAAAEAIHRTLTATHGGRLSVQTLLQRLVPDENDAGTIVVRETLRELRTVHAVTGEDDQVAIRDDLDGASMREIVLRSIIEDVSERDFWAGEDEGTLHLAGGLDVARATSWLLTLPVSGAAWSWRDSAPSVEQEQADVLPYPVVGNESRWRPCVRWASYLGLARSVSNYNLVPDPTAAIRRELPQVFADVPRQSLDEFVERLSDILPMLDGGTFHRALRIHCNVRWSSDVSPALTLALVRLREEGSIELDPGRADARKTVLADDQGAYTGVSWTAKEAR